MGLPLQNLLKLIPFNFAAVANPLLLILESLCLPTSEFSVPASRAWMLIEKAVAPVNAFEIRKAPPSRSVIVLFVAA